MISRKVAESDSFHGDENSEITPLFYPENTQDQIRYSLAHSIISPGKKTKKHKMKSAEVYFILEGEGKIHVDKESKKISKNQSLFIPPYTEQYVENIGNIDLRVLCIVDPAWKEEDEILS